MRTRREGSTLGVPHFSFMRTGRVGSTLGVSAFFFYADRKCGFHPWCVRIFRLCGLGVRVPPLVWPHFSFLRTGRVGSTLGVSAFFVYADKERGFHPWCGHIFLLCGQEERVPPLVCPHFSFMRTGSVGSTLGVAAFFYESRRNGLHTCSMIPVFLVFLKFWESYTLFDSRFAGFP